ncbi:hypothetical protein Maq22A_1p38425 (plasmid) [Methylobacterium aquaticum]|uniref:Uncharacterized protein n=1 Tax=Methylobacterium aquaticum TaxID=270351 RepID=A0A1Y0ZFZ3_9HYPH|nr:hypothetical protein Maq22A_1p38425 [Methylobacterium aquaticum]
MTAGRGPDPSPTTGRTRPTPSPYRSSTTLARPSHRPAAAQWAGAGGGRAALAPVDLERLLAGVELRDLRGQRVR